MSTPFTYFLLHKPTGMKYYGVKTARGCDPTDLWTKYFSSSKLVHALIKEYGKESFQFEVRRVFKSPAAAKLWESKVQRRMGVDLKEDWLNRHIQSGRFYCTEHSSETRAKISKAMTGRIMTEEHKRRISEKSLIDRQKRSDKGWRMPRAAVESMRQSNLGRVHAPEGVERMKASKRGKVREYLSDGSWIMV
jgi:hypothetical protein